MIWQWRRKLPDGDRGDGGGNTVAKDNDGNGDGNNYNDDDEATLTAVVAVKGMTMKKDSGRQGMCAAAIAPAFIIFSGVGRPVSNDCF